MSKNTYTSLKSVLFLLGTKFLIEIRTRGLVLVESDHYHNLLVVKS